MNADSFADLLANPFRLHQLSYHELRSLVLDYPWCQSLRMLLALKSKMDGREDQQSDLEMAAAYAPDRDYWYQQVVTGLSSESLADGIVMQEDYLELKDLTHLEPEQPKRDSTSDQAALAAYPDARPSDEPDAEPSEVASTDFAASQSDDGPKAPQPHSRAAGSADFNDPDQSVAPEFVASQSAAPVSADGTEREGGGPEISDDTTIDEDPLESLFEEAEQEMSPDPESSIQWADNPVDTPLLFMLEGVEDSLSLRPTILPAVQAAICISGVIEMRRRQGAAQSADEPLELSAIEPERPAAPQPKSSFHSWLKQFASPHPLQDWREEPAHVAETSRTDDEHAEKAEKSVTENDELATETLAALLERQGQVDKAIEIYERLSLKFPKKSALFAGKIQQLKNNR